MLLSDGRLSRGLDRDGTQASGLRFEPAPAVIVGAGLDGCERARGGINLGNDRRQVGDGKTALGDRGAETIRDASLTTLSPLDIEPGGLETAGGGIARFAGLIEAGARQLRTMSECCVCLGGGLAAVQRLIKPLACLLEAGPRGAPLLMREAATQLREPRAHRAQLERRD